MPYFFFTGLAVGAIIGVEALYRWSNDLALTWEWAAYRALFFGVVMLVSHWFSRREARKARTGPSSGGGLFIAGFWILFGGVATVAWAWRCVDALLNGKIIVSSSGPDVYTFWAINPGGFAFSVTMAFLAALLFFVMFLLGVMFAWNAIRARKGPAWP